MTRFSMQPRDLIFVKGYGFLSFSKNADKNIGRNISKNLSSKYSPGMLAMRQKLLDLQQICNKSATDAIKTSLKIAIQKRAEPTGNLIGNKYANAVAKSYDGKITRASKNSQQNNLETVKDEHD